jgi:sugar phosphate isomerase/epimerase
MTTSIKLAAYLDEASDDPAKSGEILMSKNISGVCLRRAWCRDINGMPDSALGTLSSILSQYKLSPVLLHTDIGCVLPEKLTEETPRLTRALQICKFLKCKSLRIGIGLASSSTEASEMVYRWLNTVTTLSISYDVSLLFEPDYTSYINTAGGIAVFLNKRRRFNLLYDPAVLVMRVKINPFVEFWSLLKSRINFIDVHDHKSGDSARPAGYGDAQLDLTIADAIASKFSGWFCLEPGLGRRYGDITNKEKTFLYSLDAFHSLLQRIQLPKIL